MGKDFWANLVFCSVLAVFLVFAVTKIGSSLTAKGLLASEPHASPEAVSLLKDVAITQYSIVQDRHHKIVADFYIRNNSSRDVKNINVLCDFFDEKGKYLDREKWILSRIFPSGEEHKFASVLERYINMKGTSDCRVTDLQLDADPIFKLHRSTGGHQKAKSGEVDHTAPQSGGH